MGKKAFVVYIEHFGIFIFNYQKKKHRDKPLIKITIIFLKKEVQYDKGCLFFFGGGITFICWKHLYCLKVGIFGYFSIVGIGYHGKVTSSKCLVVFCSLLYSESMYELLKK